MANSSEKALDNIDWRILSALQEDARCSFSEIGRRIGLTQPAVAERVRRLEAAGVIRGYYADVDLTQVGLPIMAFIRMSVSSAQCAAFGSFIQSVPVALQAHRLTGDDSYLVQVAVASVQHLEAVIDLLSPFGQPKTALVLSSAVTHRVIDEQSQPQA
ncbi:MAG: Lrp/AsnC family transcriptional regulator [Chloroflexaceae bacterium]|nr:Lrp/AsnC family transcriptional regulator [Chloroflexaceae bacterium]